MKYFLIYKLTSPSGKCYIGQTKQKFYRRLNEHKSNSKKLNYPLYNAIRKYGWINFKKEILEEKIAENKIDDLEKYYIKENNSLKPFGYNLQSGGNKNKHFSKLTKNKMSQNNAKNMSGKFGKEHPNAKKIFQLDLKGNFIKEWDSIIDIQRNLNIKASNIGKVCRQEKKYKTAGGYIWKYKENINA